MNLEPLRFRIGLFALIFLGVSLGLQAQTVDPTLTPTRGIIPTGSYTFSDIETINNQNGNLLFKIPLASLPPGRGGLTAGLSLVYNSKTYDIATQEMNPGCQTGTGQSLQQTQQTLIAGGQGGWHYAFSYILGGDYRPDHTSVQSPCTPPACDLKPSRLNLTFPDGSTHLLVPAGLEQDALINNGYTAYTVTSNGPGLYNCDFNLDPSVQQTLQGTRQTPLYTIDGTRVRVDAPTNTQYTISFPDGHRVVVNGSIQKIYDRNGNDANGNFITISAAAASASGSQATIVDPMGRNITIAFSDSFTTPDTIAATGVGGSTALQWQVFQNAFCTSNTYQSQLPVPAPPSQMAPVIACFQGVTQIVLPPQLGSLSFNIGYGEVSGSTTVPNWGEVHSLTLPSGATTTYIFARDNLTAGTSPTSFTPEAADVVANTVSGKVLTYTTPSVSGPIPATEAWGYQFPATATTNISGTIITAPDGGTTTEVFDPILGLSLETIRAVNGVSQEIVERAWSENRPSDGTQPLLAGSPVAMAQNPFVSSEFTSHADGIGNLAITSVKQFGEDQNGNATQSIEYGYTTYGNIPRTNGLPTGPGSAPLLRNTQLTYFGPAPHSGTLCNPGTGFYCDPQAPRVLTSVKSKQVANAVASPPSSLAPLSSVSAMSQYCYDDPTGTGNVTLEAKWDSTRSAATASIASCSNGSGAALSDAVGTNWTYDSYGNKASQTDPNGFQTSWNFGSTTDNNGNSFSGFCLTQTMLAVGRPEQETTSANCDFYSSLPTKQFDANGVETDLTYDPFGRPTSVTKATSHTTTTYSDTNLYAITTTDQDGSGSTLRQNVTIHRFDPLGRLRLTQTLESGTLGSAATDETQGIKVERRYRYSSPNSYQLVSNPYRQLSEPTMGWTLTTFDQLQRPIQVTHCTGSSPPAPWGGSCPSTGSTITTYAANATTSSTAFGPAYTTTVTDEAQNFHTNSLDAAGRLLQVNEAGQFNTSYAYDVLDNLNSVNQSGLARSFQYSSLSRLTQASNPESSPINYTYDNNGNLRTRADSRVSTTYAAYDGLNRPTQKSYAGVSTPAVQYCYDGTFSINGGACSPGSASFATGRLTSVSSSASTTNYTGYDALGRVLGSQQTTAGVPYPFSYSYNLAGALNSIRYPSNRQVVYTYDAADRVDSACSVSSLGTTSNYTNPGSVNPPACSLPAAGSGPTQPPVPILYASHGAISNLTFGNGLAEQTLFNARLQPTQITAGTLLTLGYSYSPTQNNGNLQSQTISGNGLSGQLTQSYTYDSLNRLTGFTEAASGAPNQSYSYDAFGNRGMMGSSWMPYPTQTPAPGSFAGNQWTGASYDGSGNQIAITGMTNSFGYDAENRQINASINNFPASYVYDGDGRRVQKIVCPQQSTPCTASSTGATVTTFVYDAQGQLAAEYGGPTNPRTGVTYLTADHLGSTRLVTDGTASPVERFDFAPFGEELTQGIDGRVAPFSTNAYPTAMLDAVTEKFTSKERDAETGLDFFGARYFSGAQGRFTSADDPIVDQYASDPQSWNLYSYVRNNPLRNIDPTGQDCITTSNQTDKSVTVTVTSGDCGRGGGAYVAGTVDTKSLSFDGSKINYSFTPYNNEVTFGTGTIALGIHPDPDPGILALQRGTQLAAPGVNAAYEGLKLFGFFISAPLMAATECAAKGKECSAATTAMAMIPGGGEEETAAQLIARSRAGKVLREFPGQYLDATLKEITKDAKAGIPAARKALKLLKDTRDKFKK